MNIDFIFGILGACIFGIAIFCVCFSIHLQSKIIKNNVTEIKDKIISYCSNSTNLFMYAILLTILGTFLMTIALFRTSFEKDGVKQYLKGNYKVEIRDTYVNGSLFKKDTVIIKNY